MHAPFTCSLTETVVAVIGSPNGEPVDVVEAGWPKAEIQDPTVTAAAEVEVIWRIVVVGVYVTAVCPVWAFWTCKVIPLMAAIVPDVPGGMLGLVDPPLPGAAVVDVVDAPEDPPQAANAKPAMPTKDRATMRRVRRVTAFGMPAAVVSMVESVRWCMSSSLLARGTGGW